MTDSTQVTPDALAQAVAAIRELRERMERLDNLLRKPGQTAGEDPSDLSDVRGWYVRDVRLLLAVLADAEARAGRYKAERDAALTIATNMSFVANVGVVLPSDLRELKAAIAHAAANVQPGTSATLADDDGNGGVTGGE